MTRKFSKIKEIRDYLKRSSTIKELAPQFDSELEIHLPVAVMPNSSLVFNGYLISKQPNKRWALISIENKDILDEFNLKSCALLAAKARSLHNLPVVSEIKRLDRRYWAAQVDTLALKNSIKVATDLEHYLILENRIEHCQNQLELCRYKIQRAFATFFA